MVKTPAEEWKDKIIEYRKLSSAASAGNAAIAHMRDWHLGTNGEWTSFSVLTDGKQYGVSDNLIFSFPVTVDNNGNWTMVEGLELSEESVSRIKHTEKELLDERALVENLLG